MDRRVVIAGLAGCVLAPVARAQIIDTTSFPDQVAIGAELRAAKAEIYDPAYVRLAYPMGDVPDDRGVCADTVVRAFRHAGVDLQVLVHEDMLGSFSTYPQLWGLKRPDRNIDHRRVPNLETFFRRRGGARTPSKRAADFQPGDIVSWRLTGSGLPHIGIVTRKASAGEPLMAHNIGAGTQIEPVLFAWPMAGWFRFTRWA
ncbi:MAG: DUF1287 domain-containing protein [Alphaproteobacteria bacterium]